VEPSELTQEQKEELKKILEKRDDWTIKEVRTYIKRNLVLSTRHVSRLLKSSGMKYSKPLSEGIKPESAEEELKKLEEPWMRPQLNADTQRLWSFNKPAVEHHKDENKHLRLP